jgi:hypothetical protein
MAGKFVSTTVARNDFRELHKIGYDQTGVPSPAHTRMTHAGHNYVYDSQNARIRSKEQDSGLDACYCNLNCTGTDIIEVRQMFSRTRATNTDDQSAFMSST